MNDLLQLMHNTMSPVNRIKSLVDLIKRSTTKNHEMLDKIKESADDLNAALDTFYKEQNKVN